MEILVNDGVGNLLIVVVTIGVIISIAIIVIVYVIDNEPEIIDIKYNTDNWIYSSHVSREVKEKNKKKQPSTYSINKQMGLKPFNIDYDSDSNNEDERRIELSEFKYKY